MIFHHQPANKGWVWEVLPEELSSQLLKLCDLFLILFLLGIWQIRQIIETHSWHGRYGCVCCAKATVPGPQTIYNTHTHIPKASVIVCPFGICKTPTTVQILVICSTATFQIWAQWINLKIGDPFTDSAVIVVLKPHGEAFPCISPFVGPSLGSHPLEKRHKKAARPPSTRPAPLWGSVLRPGAPAWIVVI